MYRQFILIMSLAAVVAACSSPEPTGLATGELTVDHMPPDSEGAVVNQLAEIAILPLEADPMAAETLNDLTLTGQADIGSGWSTSDFDAVVVNCGLFDGLTQFGGFIAPDATGRMAFAALAIEVDAGDTRLVSVRCEMDGTVEQPAGDRITVGIASDVDVVAVDGLGASVPVTVSEDARREAGTVPGEMPMAATTVFPSGTFGLTLASDTPATAVSVGAGDVDRVLAAFTAPVGPEDATFSRVRICAGGDSALVGSVTVRVDGIAVGSATLPAGLDASGDLMLAAPVTLTRDMAHSVELVAHVPALVARSSVGAAPGVALWGSQGSLGICVGSGGSWAAEYAGQLNLEVTGVDSGAPFYIAALSALAGNTLPFYTGAPTIAVAAQSESMLTTDTMTLFQEFTVTPPAGSTTHLAAFRLLMDRSRSADGPPDYQADNLMVEIDGVPMGTSSYAIYDFDGYDQDVYGLRWWNLPNQLLAYIVFSEPLEVNAATTIRVSGTFGGNIPPGEIVDIRLDPTEGPAAAGFIFNRGRPNSDLQAGPFIDPGLDPQTPGGELAQAGILWSDGSELGHNFSAGADGGSPDWANGGSIVPSTVWSFTN